jgi:hypothetical protein
VSWIGGRASPAAACSTVASGGRSGVSGTDEGGGAHSNASWRRKRSGGNLLLHDPTERERRLSQTDAENIVTIANAMRSERQPFITRSAALKLALTAVAADPERFVAAAKGAAR